MVFLVGLGKLIKRIWKKYRWLSYAICIITFSTLYDYIHSIITHTIICFPMWIWGIIPVVTILIFFAKFGIKKKSIFLQVVLGCCFGIVVTGVLCVLFYATNYWFTIPIRTILTHTLLVRDIFKDMVVIVVGDFQNTT